MKLSKNQYVAMIFLSIASSSNYAANINDNYVPPKQLTCTIANNKVTCDGINNMYLKGGSYNSTIEKNVPVIINFDNATAYTSFNNYMIFYTYRTVDNKLVQLNKTYSQITPDLKDANWVSHSSNTVYLCKTNCPITNLPI